MVQPSQGCIAIGNKWSVSISPNTGEDEGGATTKTAFSIPIVIMTPAPKWHLMQWTYVCLDHPTQPVSQPYGPISSMSDAPRGKLYAQQATARTPTWRARPRQTHPRSPGEPPCLHPGAFLPAGAGGPAAWLDGRHCGRGRIHARDFQGPALSLKEHPLENLSPPL